MRSFQRALSALLAILMLAGFACAAQAEEEYVISIAFEADEDQMTAFDMDLGGDGKIGRAIAELLNKLTLTGSSSERDAVFFLNAEDTVLLDFAERWTVDGHLQLTSSLLPELILDVTDAANLSAEKPLLACLSDALGKILAQQESLLSETENWAVSLKRTVETGIFAGDAYSGGTIRTSVECDDRDFALLGIRLLDKLEGMEEALASCGLDWNEIRTALKDELMEMASANEHRYILRAVTNAQDEPVGFSLTAFRGEAQILTLSLGQNSDGTKIKAVLGLGYDNQVYMLAAEISFIQSSETANIKGEIKLWQDPYREGYRAAVTDGNNLLGTLSIDRLDVVKVGETTTTVYDLSLLIPGKKMIRETGRIVADGKLQWSDNLYYDNADTPILTVRISAESGEPLPYTWPEGKIVALSRDEATMQQAGEEIQQALIGGATALGFRLMNVIPLELWPVVMDLFQ